MDNSNLPKQFKTIIALLQFDDMPPIPVVGFIAPTTDTNEPYLHTLPSGEGYLIDHIKTWDYLEDVAPKYAGVKNNKK